MPLCTSGGLGLGVGLKNLVLFTSLVLRLVSCPTPIRRTLSRNEFAKTFSATTTTTVAISMPAGRCHPFQSASSPPGEVNGSCNVISAAGQPCTHAQWAGKCNVAMARINMTSA